jgi:glutathione S-transferase
LFEAGSIIFHIAQGHAGLLPDDPDVRAGAITWMFAALSMMESPIIDLVVVKLVEGGKSWTEQHLPLVMDRICGRLAELSSRLCDADWLDGAFGAGDLMMVEVLCRLGASGRLDEYPNLAAYVARAEARFAFKRAFAAQLVVFTGQSPLADKSLCCAEADEVPSSKAGSPVRKPDHALSQLESEAISRLFLVHSL